MTSYFKVFYGYSVAGSGDDAVSQKKGLILIFGEFWLKKML